MTNSSASFMICLVFSVFIAGSCTPATKSTLVKPPVLTSILVRDTAAVTKVPDSLNYDPFYKKYVDARGIAVVSSARVPDKALIQARNIVIQMLTKVPEVKDKLI